MSSDDPIFIARLEQCAYFRRALEVLITKVAKNSLWGDGGDTRASSIGVVGRFEVSAEGIRVFIDTAEQALQGSSSFASDFFDSFSYNHPEPVVRFEVDLATLTALITPPKDSSAMPPVTFAYPFKASVYPSAPARPGAPSSFLSAATAAPHGARRRPGHSRVEVDTALCVSYCADGAVIEAFLETSPANPAATSRLHEVADATDPVVKLTCLSGLLRTAVLPDSVSLIADADDTVTITVTPATLEFSRDTAATSRTVALRTDARDIGEFICLPNTQARQPTAEQSQQSQQQPADQRVKAERELASASQSTRASQTGAPAASGGGESSADAPWSFSYIGKHLITAMKGIKVGSTEWSQLTMSSEGVLRIAHRLTVDARAGGVVQVSFVMLSLLPGDDHLAP